MSTFGRTAAKGLGAVMSVGVALYAYGYLTDVGPKVPQVLANAFAHPWLSVHVAGGGTALLLGPFNFLKGLRRRRPGVHRLIGRTYILACAAGGAAGVVLALGSTAGPVASAGFGALGCLWLFAAYQGYRSAREGRFDAHRRWMIRSFALTFAAVTLRLDLPLLILSGAPFLPGYRLISFLCWVPNLLMAEAYLRGAFGRRTPDLRLSAEAAS